MAEDIQTCVVTCVCESEYASLFEWSEPDVDGNIYPVPSQRCGICPPGQGGIQRIRALFGPGSKDTGVDIPNAFNYDQDFTTTTSTFKDTVRANVTCPECKHEFKDNR